MPCSGPTLLLQTDLLGPNKPSDMRSGTFMDQVGQKFRQKSLISSTINIHITQRFVRCTDTENDIWVTPSMTGVLEEAFLLNLRPAMYYVRARRNGLLRYATTRLIYQHFDSTFASPTYFLEPTTTTSRFGSPDLFRDPIARWLVHYFKWRRYVGL